MSQLSIDIVQEDLLDLKADACVCTIHRSKDLSKGKLSSKISMAAGPKLQNKLNSASVEAQRDLDQGDVVEAVPEDLSSNFQILYFVCLRTWREGNEKDLQRAIEHILDDAAGKHLTSVALPPLGMGGQKYPSEKVAHAIMQGVMAFNLDNPDSSLKSVKVSLFRQKDEMLQAFTDILIAGIRLYETSTQVQASVDNKSQLSDNNGNPQQSNCSLLAQPVSTLQPNLLGRLLSYFGRTVPVYRFYIGPVCAGVRPHVSLNQRGLGGELTVGVTFSIDALPVGVRAVFSKIFNRS